MSHHVSQSHAIISDMQLPMLHPHSGANGRGVAVVSGTGGAGPDDGVMEAWGGGTHERDEFGHVLLSKSRASFPKSRAHLDKSREPSPPSTKPSPLNKKRAASTHRASTHREHPAEGAGGEGVERGSRGSGGGAVLRDELLEELAAVESMERVAKKRLARFQDRMTPRGFKGGTIIQDHIDFGGGKGADADGERHG